MTPYSSRRTLLPAATVHQTKGVLVGKHSSLRPQERRRWEPTRNTQVVLLLIQTGDNRSPRRDTSYSDGLVSRVAAPPVLFWPRI